jgi:zinc transporter 1/2/3
MDMRIGGVFIILVASFIGICSTYALGVWKSAKALFALNLAKYFGIGIMVSTAWMHLLPHAFENFNNPCVKEYGVWGSYGTNWVGVLAMIATFFVQMIEFLMNLDGRIHSHGPTLPALQTSHSQLSSSDLSSKPADVVECDCTDSMPVAESFSMHESRLTDIPFKGLKTVAPPLSEVVVAIDELDQCAVHGNPVTTLSEQSDRHAEWSVIMLEVGILIHSFIIGITLGVVDNDGYTALLIAMAFHQVRVCDVHVVYLPVLVPASVWVLIMLLPSVPS